MKKLISGLMISIPLLGIAQISDHYKLLIVEGDSGVWVALPQYRVETNLIRFQKSLIDSLNSESISLNKEIMAFQQLKEKNDLLLKEHSNILKAKDQIIFSQKKQINLLLKEVKKPKSFWQRNKHLKFIAGALAGGTIVYLLKN